MKWKDLNAKQRRNGLIFLAIVAAMLAVLLWPSGTWRRKPASRPVPARTVVQAGRGAPPPAPRPVSLPAKDAGMLGKWEGDGAELANHRVCRLWLEIGKNAEEPDKYTGAATLSCIPILGLSAPKPDTPQAMLMARLNPLAATMSGAWEKDAIAFRMDKQLNAGDCVWTRFSVARFGSQNLSAEIADACGGGSALLRRSQ